jgi:release factor glutamine methyltransferase
MIYAPREDSHLLEREVKNFARGKNVLDVGTGSGIQALAAKNVGAKSITACDINKEAVDYVNSIGIKCIKSNLFDKIKGKFDLIIFNPPYLPEDKREDAESRIITSGGKRGDEITLKFVKQAVEHLEKQGIILLLLSSLTPRNRIFELTGKLSLKHKVISSERLFGEELYVLEIKRKD